MIEKRQFSRVARLSSRVVRLASAAFLLLLWGCGRPRETGAPALSGEPIPGAETLSKYESSLQKTETISEESSMTESTETEMKQLTEDALPSPGVKTLENFLRTALLPLGNTMYVWGGGWNEEDTGAGEEARTLGVSPRWECFADLQDASYNYRETRYQIHDGLDCSGYVGWTVYNTMETQDNLDGYVHKSTDTAQLYAQEGWGSFTSAADVTDHLAGDIMSMNGHVWICLGTCEDGSVLLIHSSPPGVRLCGTAADGQSSQAVSLAEEYMSIHYPNWYSRYPGCVVGDNYLQKSGQMRWNTETFADADSLRALSPRELLDKLFAD